VFHGIDDSIELNRVGKVKCFSANVPRDLFVLAFVQSPAREVASAGGMLNVPNGQGLGRLVCLLGVVGGVVPRLRYTLYRSKYTCT